MSRAMLLRIGGKIRTAAAVAALITISALSVPAAAFAAPPRPEDPVDCAIDPTRLSCQTNESNLPTSPDDPRCNGSPLSVGCEGGPFDEDPITGQWPSLTGDSISHSSPHDPGQPPASSAVI
jgi:hypothetical protein